MTREREVEFYCDALGARPLSARLPVSYNVAPTQLSLIVRRAPGGEREGAIARWGLIPPWTKDMSIGSRLINARAETITEKPAFRSSLEVRRCVVPTDSFYEWRKLADARRKQPWRILRADGKPLRLAGLWETWDSGDDAVESFTIITVAASAFMKRLHDRMPAILEPEDMDVWLDTHASVNSVRGLLRPAADGVLLAHPVSERVNSPANDDPTLIDPVDSA